MPGRQLRDPGPRGLGDDERVRRRHALDEPAYAFALHADSTTIKVSGSAVSIAVRGDGVLAFQHAASRLAPVARRRDQAGGLLESGIVGGADARHGPSVRCGRTLNAIPLSADDCVARAIGRGAGTTTGRASCGN